MHNTAKTHTHTHYEQKKAQNLKVVIRSIFSQFIGLR